MNDILKGAIWFVAPFFCVITLVFFGVLKLSNINTNLSTLALINSLLLYPIFEEIIFRGLILEELLRFKALTKKKYLISFANVLTSILFALLHFIILGGILSLLVFFPSLIIGMYYEKNKHLILAIILHSWFNFIALFYVPLW